MESDELWQETLLRILVVDSSVRVQLYYQGERETWLSSE